MDMKRFLLRLSAFLSVALLGCMVLFIAIVGRNRQSVEACRLEPGIEAVIVGDSHTAWAINDAGMEGVRNVSLNAEGYKYTYAKLEHLLRNEPTVRRVYLGFSYHNLSGYYDDYIVGDAFRRNISRYLSVLSAGDYLDLVDRDPAGIPDLFLRVVRGGYSNAIRGGCTLYGRFSDNPMTAQFDAETMQKRVLEQYYAGGELQPVSELNLTYLNRIVQLARDRDVELIMLNTPMHAEYREAVPEYFVRLYEDYLEKHDLRSFDFGDLRLGDADFLPDGDHTNLNGALKTSARFAEYHRNAWHP